MAGYAQGVLAEGTAFVGHDDPLEGHGSTSIHMLADGRRLQRLPMGLCGYSHPAHASRLHKVLADRLKTALDGVDGEAHLLQGHRAEDGLRSLAGEYNLSELLQAVHPYPRPADAKLQFPPVGEFKDRGRVRGHAEAGKERGREGRIRGAGVYQRLDCQEAFALGVSHLNLHAKRAHDARSIAPSGEPAHQAAAVFRSRRYSSMAAAARLASARAVTTRSAPRTLSPAAKTPPRLVRPLSSAATVPQPVASRSGLVWKRSLSA